MKRAGKYYRSVENVFDSNKRDISYLEISLYIKT